MTLDDFLSEFRRQPTFSRGGQRAPHKALALLYAMGRFRAGERLIRFSDGAPKVGALLEQFGPPRAVQHPEQPIWRLRPRSQDARAIWEVRIGDSADLPQEDNPPIAALNREGEFGLSSHAAALFTAEPESLELAATVIADMIVPESLREQLLMETIGARDANNLPAADAARLQSHSRVLVYRARRDATFPRRVLEAYGHRCAVCEASPQIGDERFGLEAAHIRWIQANGPNDVQNGLCLCRMHHVALDRGALTLSEDLRVRVSPLVDRSPQSDVLFWQYDSEHLRMPLHARHAPHGEHCAWHRSEVFRANGTRTSSDHAD